MAKRSLQIQKDVPIPKKNARLGSNMAVLDSMVDGESIWWPLEEEKKVLRFYRVAKRMNTKVTICRVGERDPNGPGVRMWRVPVNGADFVEEE